MRAVTYPNGTVTQTYGTDEFGVVNPALTQGSSNQPIQYTGEERDKETGFVYLRARMYDPSLGRFLTRDALPGRQGSSQSLNRYSYVQNNPIRFVDPSGHELNRALANKSALPDTCFSILDLLPVDGLLDDLFCLQAQREPQRRFITLTQLQTPFGPRVLGRVVAAATPQDDDQGQATVTITEWDPAGAFTAEAKTSSGKLLDLLASVVVQGTRAVLTGISVCPKAGDKVEVGLRELVEVARVLGRQQGWTEMVISGYRVSGANPQRFTRPITIRVE